MKYLVVNIVFLAFSISTYAQNLSWNMTKLGSWTDGDTSTYYNDCWGYESYGREYAILGSNHSTHFLDISDPDNIKEVGRFTGAANDVIWRDFKTYDHYAYGVADGDTNNTLQIFDLQYLPDSVVKVYDSNEFTRSSHNVFIDGDRLYLATNSRDNKKYALDILSLNNPEKPVFLASIDPSYFDYSYVHDLYVRNDTAYCSAEYSGLVIVDLTDTGIPEVITYISAYPDKGYCHSNWVSEDSKYIVMADEVPNGMDLKLFDISDITNPILISQFHSHDDARPHNPFIRQNKIVSSYYSDGVYMWNINDSTGVELAGYYDTYPDNDNDTVLYPENAFDGCWGVYLYLPSGKILASDDTYGLFVLETPEILGVKDEFKNQLEFKVTKTNNIIFIENNTAFERFELYDIKGNLILSVKAYGNSSVLNINDLSGGVYTIKGIAKKGYKEKRILIE